VYWKRRFPASSHGVYNVSLTVCVAFWISCHRSIFPRIPWCRQTFDLLSIAEALILCTLRVHVLSLRKNVKLVMLNLMSPEPSGYNPEPRDDLDPANEGLSSIPLLQLHESLLACHITVLSHHVVVVMNSWHNGIFKQWPMPIVRVSSWVIPQVLLAESLLDRRRPWALEM